MVLFRFLRCWWCAGARRGQDRSSGGGLHLDRACAPAGGQPWRNRRRC